MWYNQRAEPDTGKGMTWEMQNKKLRYITIAFSVLLLLAMVFSLLGRGFF